MDPLLTQQLLAQGIELIFSSSDEVAVATLQTLIAVASNIIVAPTEEKFRRLRADNRGTKTKILDVPGGDLVLHGLGFVLNDDNVYVLEPNEAAWATLLQGKEMLEVALTSIGSGQHPHAVDASSGDPQSKGIESMAARLSANPELAAELINSNPLLGRLADENPGLRDILNDPATMQAMLGMLGSDPAMMRAAMSAAASHPEAFAAFSGALGQAGAPPVAAAAPPARGGRPRSPVAYNGGDDFADDPELAAAIRASMAAEDDAEREERALHEEERALHEEERRLEEEMRQREMELRRREEMMRREEAMKRRQEEMERQRAELMAQQRAMATEQAKRQAMERAKREAEESEERRRRGQ